MSTVSQCVAAGTRTASRSSRLSSRNHPVPSGSTPNTRSIHSSLHASRPPTLTSPLSFHSNPTSPSARLSSHGSGPSVSSVRAFSPGPGAARMPPATVGGGLGGAGGAAGAKKPPSNHLVWYREIVPAMLPVIAIGTTIFFALSLTQTHLSHSRALTESSLRISHLEAELAQLSAQQRRQAIQTKTWGESLGRVLSQVGVGSGSGHGQGEKKEGQGVLAGPREVAGEGIKEFEEKAVDVGRRWWGGNTNAGTAKLA